MKIVVEVAVIIPTSDKDNLLSISPGSNGFVYLKDQLGRQIVADRKTLIAALNEVEKQRKKHIGDKINTEKKPAEIVTNELMWGDDENL